MNAFERKIALRVVGVHVGIIGVMLVSTAIRGCVRKKPKEMITFIEFGGPAAQVSVQSVDSMPEPAAPTPAPRPEPAPIPEPAQPQPIPRPKPKPKVETPAPKPKPEPKPKWTPTKVEDIRKGKKIEPRPTRPTISSKDINKALSGIGESVSAGNPSRFGAYYARVMTVFYNQWKPPASGSAAAGSASVKIWMLKNGKITRRVLKTSGDPLYDRTCMDAANAVQTLPRPPADYPYDYVEIIFTLDR